MGDVAQPTGEIIREWTEFGRSFLIEKLVEPRRVGNYLRHYRLWDIDHQGVYKRWAPSTGGQWHYTVEGAEDRARYVSQGDYIRRVEWLENQVNVLTRELAVMRGETYRLGDPPKGNTPGEKRWYGSLCEES